MNAKKWCIINEQDDSFLRWDHAVLTFDTIQSAEEFVDSVYATAAIETDYLAIVPFVVHTIDATNLICVRNGDDIELKEVGDNG